MIWPQQKAAQIVCQQLCNMGLTNGAKLWLPKDIFLEWMGGTNLQNSHSKNLSKEDSTIFICKFQCRHFWTWYWCQWQASILEPHCWAWRWWIWWGCNQICSATAASSGKIDLSSCKDKGSYRGCLIFFYMAVEYKLIEDSTKEKKNWKQQLLERLLECIQNNVPDVHHAVHAWPT